MKYVKKFQDLEIKEELVYYNNSTKKKFKEEFFKLYPKKETKIHFTDSKEINYTLEFYDLKVNSNTNYELIFNAENNYKVYVKNPFYISDKDELKISLFPVTITPESKELINKMFEEGDILL